MTASKHERTKGPWSFESDETSDGQMFTVYDEHGQRLTDPYISEAHARRISALPALVEALEKTEAVMTIVEPRSHKAEYLDALESIRSALSALSLAKTEGQP